MTGAAFAGARSRHEAHCVVAERHARSRALDTAMFRTRAPVLPVRLRGKAKSGSRDFDLKQRRVLLTAVDVGVPGVALADSPLQRELDGQAGIELVARK